jgi:hypothetical protein
LTQRSHFLRATVADSRSIFEVAPKLDQLHDGNLSIKLYNRLVLEPTIAKAKCNRYDHVSLAAAARGNNC